jgi:hypothetical protein
MASLDGRRQVVNSLPSMRTLVDYHRIVLGVKSGKYIRVKATHTQMGTVFVAFTRILFSRSWLRSHRAFAKWGKIKNDQSESLQIV